MESDPESPTNPSMDTTPKLSRYTPRTIAFALDSFLGSIIAAVLIVLFIFPVFQPDFQERIQELQELISQFSVDEQQNLEIQSQMTEIMAPLSRVGSIAYLIIMTLFYAGIEILTKGSSLGKMLFRYRVYTTIDQQPIRPWISLTRSFIKTFTIVVTLPGFLGTVIFTGIVLLPVFTKRRQALHDLLLKTVLVDERPLWVRVDPKSPHSPNQGDVIDL